jgi:hypothetical protein
MSCCQAIDALRAAAPDVQTHRLLYLSTDGDENASTGPCAGPASVSSTAPYDPGSWHRLVYEKANDPTLPIVLNSVLWGSSVSAFAGARMQSLDPETKRAQPMSVMVSDYSFFSTLAASTNGTFSFIADGDAGPVTTLPGSTPLSLALMGLGLLIISVYVTRRAYCSVA